MSPASATTRKACNNPGPKRFRSTGLANCICDHSESFNPNEYSKYFSRRPQCKAWNLRLLRISWFAKPGQPLSNLNDSNKILIDLPASTNRGKLRAHQSG